MIFSKKLIFHRFWSSENQLNIDFSRKSNKNLKIIENPRLRIFCIPDAVLCTNFQVSTPKLSFSNFEKLFRFSREEVPLEFLEAGIRTTLRIPAASNYKGYVKI